MVVEKTVCNAFWRTWSPQAENCRKDQRMSKPDSIFRKPEFHKFSCFSILRNQAMKEMPHEQSKETRHESQAEKKDVSESCAHRPALQPWSETECSRTRTDKSRIKGNLRHVANWNTSHPVWRVRRHQEDEEHTRNWPREGSGGRSGHCLAPLTKCKEMASMKQNRIS